MKFKINRKRLVSLLLLVLICSVILGGTLSASAETTGTTCVINIHGEVNSGMAEYVKRAIAEAEESDVSAILFDVDTPGGTVDAAKEISRMILNTTLPTVSFINDDALSAGVLISISAEHLVMSPGSSIGAAEIRPYEEKYNSFWTKELSKVAEVRGRDKKLVEAMSDASIEIPEVIAEGKILTLTTEEAMELGLIDAVANTQKDALELFQLPIKTVELGQNNAEKIAQFITKPYIATGLLVLGLVFMVAELFTAGFGAFGVLSILCFAAYFGGHYIAGFAGILSILIFIVGVVLLIVEAVIPGFGIFGILGIVGVIVGVALSATSIKAAVISIAVALILTIIFAVIMVKLFPKNKFLSRLILTDDVKDEKLDEERRQVSEALLGKQGESITPLRPAGVILLDGEKYDAVTRGDYIDAQNQVVITKVEGNRIVVEKI